jgi:hypothetical protein
LIWAALHISIYINISIHNYIFITFGISRRDLRGFVFRKRRDLFVKTCISISA